MNQTHETTRHDAGVKKTPTENTKAEAAKPAEPKHVLMEGDAGIRVVRFTVNGQVKSLNRPVTGAELFRVAGQPQKLTLNGRAIEDDTDPIDLADDAALVATY